MTFVKFCLLPFLFRQQTFLYLIWMYMHHASDIVLNLLSLDILFVAFVIISTDTAKNALRFWDQTWQRTSTVVITITSNDRSFSCPIIDTDNISQCYFVHRHLNNVSYYKVHSYIRKPCLAIIVRKSNRLWFMAMRTFSNIGDLQFL